MARKSDLVVEDRISTDAPDEDGQDFSTPLPVVASATPTYGLTFEQLQQLLTRPAMDAEALATAMANATAKTMRPENKVAPKVSAYNPEGIEKPRLKCAFYQGGSPIGHGNQTQTLTVEEIHALNTLEPGAYGIRKLDGSDSIITIRAQYDANNAVQKLFILYPEGDEHKNLFPSLLDLCRQCVPAARKTPRAA